jgi:hypothetical protein
MRVGLPCSCFAVYPSKVSVAEAIAHDSVGVVEAAHPGHNLDTPAADAERTAAVFPGSNLSHDEKVGVIQAIREGRRGTINALIAAFMFPLFLLSGGVAVATLPGCATVNAYDQAESVQQRAFALYGTFAVIEERAADMIEDRRIPKTVRQRLQQLDKLTKPAADVMYNLAIQLDSARRTANLMDGATPDKITALTLQLSQAIATLAPRVTAMVNAVESARV